MNDTDPLDDISNLRFTRELRAAARQVELTPGSELAVVAAGRRRRHRRHQATAVMVVAVVAGGTGLVVQQLARTGKSSIATDDPTTTEGPTSTDPSKIPTTDPMSTVAPTPATIAADVSVDPAEGDVAAAQLVDSNLVWNVVEPDSTEAVSFASSGATTFAAPGIVVATAPGRSDESQPVVWRTDDGIRWTPSDVMPPVGSVYGLTFDGSTIYNVGTAPGIAAGAVNPLIVAVSGDDGSTWSQVELPIDANAGRKLPMVRGASAYGQPVAIDGGVLVLTYQSVDLDWQALMRRVVGEPTDGFYDMGRDGFRVLADPSCVPTPTASVVPVAEMYSAPTIAPYGDESPFGDCEVRSVSWDEAGVPPETVSAMFDNAQRAFVVRDGAATEVELPRGTSFQSVGADGEPRFVDPEGQWYRFDAGSDAFVATDSSGVSPPGWYVGGGNGVDWAIDSPYPALGGASRTLVGASTGAGEWAWTDWTALAGDGMVGMTVGTAVTGAGLTTAIAASPDPFEAAGGVEVTADGITLRRESSYEAPIVLDAETGQPIPLDLVFSDNSTGGLIVRDESGATRATLSYDDVAQIYGIDSGERGSDRRWLLQTSTDGTHVAVESIADLLTISDAEISSVPRISTDGNNTIVAVTLKERNAEGVPRQLVLVGTPRD